MSSAIQDVGRTLIDLLRVSLVDPGNPGGIQNEQIVLLSPAEARAAGVEGGVRLTLFLYSIAPAAQLRNEMEIPGLGGGDEAVSQPLDLYYLLTVFGAGEGDDLSERTLESQLLLGDAMRVFFDNGTLTGSLLRGDLPRDEELRLTLQPMTVEDLTRIWSVFPDSVLNISVSYLVTPVRLRSDRRRGGRRVTARRAYADHVVPAPPGA